MFPAVLIIVACCTLFALFLYKYLTCTYNYWKNKSVTFATPVPLFGNIRDHVTLKMTQGECLKNIYKYVHTGRRALVTSYYKGFADYTPRAPVRVYLGQR